VDLGFLALPSRFMVMKIVAHYCYTRPTRSVEEDAPGTGTGIEERLALLLNDEYGLFIFVLLTIGNCVDP
jgi:hypothetical protein